MGERPRQPARRPSGYFARSQQPLPSLALLLPLLIAYEAGALWYATPTTGRQLSARSYLQEFLELFGAVGEYLPGLAVVVVLLAWHLVRRDRWKLEPGLYAGMAVESVALALPLLVFGLLIGPRQAEAMMLAGGIGAMPWPAQIVFSIGAGIYEELVFRLVLIALVHMLLVDALGLAFRQGAFIAIFVSAALFALSHFNGGRPLAWTPFVFYFAAGLYFAFVYMLRGFGIVAATHALYDTFVVAITHGLADR